MNYLYKLVSKLPNYIRQFGIYNGIRLLLQVEKPLEIRSDRIRQYHLPEGMNPVYLRNSKGDHAIFWQCLVMVQYDTQRFSHHERLLKTYHSIIAKGDIPTIIDCGGNIGLSAIWFANTFPEARVYVIEPDDGNFEILKMNIEPYGNRIIPLKGGVWSKEGFLKIINPNAGPTAFRVEMTDEKVEGSIRAYTVEAICEMADINNPLIVKLDIEGAQSELFKENTCWVEKTHLLTLELDDWLFPWQGSSRTFFSCLSQYPFEYLLGGESIFCFRDSKQELSSF